MLVVEISNTLVNLGMMPIWDIPPLPKNGLGGLGGDWSLPEVPAREARFRRRSMGLNSGQLPSLWFLGYPTCHFFVFLFWNRCNIHINLYIYTHIGKLVPLHPGVPRSPTIVSQGPWTWVRHLVPPWWWGTS
jgi:hypothetical protein